MITWIQTVLQKHHKVVFSVLLVVITVAFVFTIGQIPFFGDRNRYEATKKNFYGFDLSDDNVVNYLNRYAYFDAALAGMRPSDVFVYRQAFLRSLAKELGLKQANESELVAYIHSLPAFRNEKGNFDEIRWKEFVDYYTKVGLGEAELTRIFAENAMLWKLEQLLGAGFALKGDVLKRYEIENGTWDFNLAVVDFAKFNPTIKPTQAQLETFYKENAASFKVGAGVVLETVFFDAADFADKNAPAETELKAYYNSNASKYSEVKDGNTVVKPFADVKKDVAKDFAKDSAIRKAATSAEDLALKVYNSQSKKSSPELKKVLADAKVVSKKSKPMRTTDTSRDNSLPRKVVDAGFRLDEQSFYADPIVDENGVWFVMLAESLPAYQPKLADVKDAVEKAFVAAEKRRLFAEYGKKLDAAFEKGLKEGKSFADIADANKVKSESVKGFSFATSSASKDVDAAKPVLHAELQKLSVGGVSKIVYFGQNGYIVNLTAFKKPQIDEKKLAEMQKYFESNMAGVSEQSILGNAIQKADVKK